MSLAARLPYFTAVARTRARRAPVSVGLVIASLALAAMAVRLVSADDSSEDSLGLFALAQATLAVSIPILSALTVARERASGAMDAALAGRISAAQILAASIIGSAFVEWIAAAIVALAFAPLFREPLSALLTQLSVFAGAAAVACVAVIAIHRPARIPLDGARGALGIVTACTCLLVAALAGAGSLGTFVLVAIASIAVFDLTAHALVRIRWKEARSIHRFRARVAALDARAGRVIDRLARLSPLCAALAHRSWRRRTLASISLLGGCGGALLWAVGSIAIAALDRSGSHVAAASGWAQRLLVAAELVALGSATAAVFAALGEDRATGALSRHLFGSMRLGHVATGYLLGSGFVPLALGGALGASVFARAAILGAWRAALLQQIVIAWILALALSCVVFMQTRPTGGSSRHVGLSTFFLGGILYVHATIFVGSYSGANELPPRSHALNTLAEGAARLGASALGELPHTPSAAALAVAVGAWAAAMLGLYAFTIHRIRRIERTPRSPAGLLSLAAAAMIAPWVLAGRDGPAKFATTVATGFAVLIATTYLATRTLDPTGERGDAPLRGWAIAVIIASLMLGAAGLPAAASAEDWMWRAGWIVAEGAVLWARFAFYEELFRRFAARAPALRFSVAVAAYGALELLAPLALSAFPFGRPPSTDTLAEVLWRGGVFVMGGGSTLSQIAIQGTLATRGANLVWMERLAAGVPNLLAPIALSLAARSLLRWRFAAPPSEPSVSRRRPFPIGAFLGLVLLVASVRVHQGPRRAIERTPDGPLAALAARMRNSLLGPFMNSGFDPLARCGSIGECDALIQLRPNYAAAYVARAAARRHVGDDAPTGRQMRQLAVADLDAAIALDPDDLDLHHKRGAARAAAGDFAGAVADYGVVLARRPRDAVAFAKRAQARVGIGDHAAAIADANESLRLSEGLLAPPSDRDSALRARGAAHLALGDYAAAASDFEDVVHSLAMPDAERIVELARAQRLAGRATAAIDTYGLALGARGDDAAIHDERGLLLLEMGRTEEAIADFDAAIARAPDESRYREHRARAGGR